MLPLRLVNKSRLIKEIDRIQKETMDAMGHFLSTYDEGVFDGLSKIENFIASMELERLNVRTAKDKWQHFGVCLVASIISPWLGIGLAIGKEYGDSKAVGNKWDWQDILADAIGVLVGGVIHGVVVYFMVN